MTTKLTDKQIESYAVRLTNARRHGMSAQALLVIGEELLAEVRASRSSSGSREIRTVEQCPPEWLDSIPYGGDRTDSVRQILAAEPEGAPAPRDDQTIDMFAPLDANAPAPAESTTKAKCANPAHPFCDEAGAGGCYSCRACGGTTEISYPTADGLKWRPCPECAATKGEEDGR